MKQEEIYKCKGCGKALTQHEKDYHICQGREISPDKEHPKETLCGLRWY